MPRRMKSALAATVLVSLAASAPAAPRLSPDQRLARAVEGRVAGEPVSCIDHSRIRSSRIIDGTAIVYNVGNVMYVNRPAGAETLDDWDVLVTRLYGSKLCDRDIVRLVDPNSRMLSGVVSLGEFVPYKKVKKAG